MITKKDIEEMTDVPSKREGQFFRFAETIERMAEALEFYSKGRNYFKQMHTMMCGCQGCCDCNDKVMTTHVQIDQGIRAFNVLKEYEGGE